MIRPAVPGDVDAISEVVNRAYSRFVPLIGRIPAPMTDDYTALVEQGSVTVSTDQDEVVGLLVSWVDGDSYYIDNIAVDPSMQGSGIGSGLLNRALERAGECGCDRVWLYTNAVMQENIGYYERRGFVVYEQRFDKGYDRIFFERRLTPPSTDR